MSSIVLDANILIRAVIGKQILPLMRKYADRVLLLAPDTAFQEARRRLPQIVARRGVSAEFSLAVLDLIAQLVREVEPKTYWPYEPEARWRIERRDVNDWPILAAAIALDCPILTEDTDFFGCGVATWTSDRIEQFLQKG